MSDVREEVRDYEALRAEFSWETARAELDGVPGGRGLNIAHEAVDRHAVAGRRDEVAIRCLDPDGGAVELTFGRLKVLTNQFANLLRELGVETGDRVFVLTDRIPELYVAALGTLKNRCVFSPLFSAYGPEPIKARLAIGRGKVLVTTTGLYAKKIAPIEGSLSDLEHVLIIPDDRDPGRLSAAAPSGESAAESEPAGEPSRAPTEEGSAAADAEGESPSASGAEEDASDEAAGTEASEGVDEEDESAENDSVITRDLYELLLAADEDFAIPPTEPEQPALLHFTSGTTGTPKGVVHVHEAVVGHYASAQVVLDLKPEDVMWCTADPGWVTGVSYGLVAPLVVGATLIVDRAEFAADRWYRILQDESVTVWYTAPTAIRMLRRYGGELALDYDLSALRLAASVGEPLSPESVRWSRKVFGHPIRDTWWQTETGSIMIAAYPGIDARPGSMGKPVPGVEIQLVERTKREDGTVGVEPVVEADVTGELAIRSGWPSMFRAYLDDEERYAACFADDWYLSGDLARRDEDGYLWFVGRIDDVIKTAGHLVGPVEVENALMEHPAVAEVGVVGRPDEIAGEVVRAFVSLNPGYEPDEGLRADILGHARNKLGPAIAPKELEFRQDLPKTRSGKIMRRILKEEDE